MHKAQLQHLKEKARAASPGPWRQELTSSVNVSSVAHHYCVTPASPSSVIFALTGEECDAQAQRNAQFIAAANPAVVQLLIAEIERLDRALDESLAENDRRHKMCDALAEGAASHFGEFIGEHSNANCPWINALQLLNTRPEFMRCGCGATTAQEKAQ